MIWYIKRTLPYNMSLRKYWWTTKWIIANVFSSHTLKWIEIVWITWTDWKTTTTSFCSQLLQYLWVPTAMMSSETHSINWKVFPNKTKRTTSSPFEIYSFIKKAKKAWCKIIILEISSHALEQWRVFWIKFDYSIVTNLSQEHLDYHWNMKEYAKSKAKLLERTKKYVIIPKDLNEKEIFKEYIKTDIIETYVWDNLINKNILIARNMRFANHWNYFDLYYKDEIIRNIFLPIIWHFNVDNLLYAIALASLVKIENPRMTLTSAIWKLEKVPWRLDDVNLWQNFRIWISYAVTPQALEKTLKYAQTVKNEVWKVWIVFWATWWQHDKWKRPIMWEISWLYSDISIITDDETYGENSMKIIDEIVRWIKLTKWEYIIIQDRKEAIHHTLKNAKRWDIVIISWMWNFDTRNVWWKEEEWNDKKIIEEFYSKD